MNTAIRMSRRSAFTLIELLLVLVILGVLAGIVVPKFTNRTQDAKIAAAKTDIASLENQLENFEMDNERYPSSEEGVRALVEQPAGLQNWKGPYIKRGVPNDPWGNPYVYRSPGQNGAYDILSYGSDGTEGGTGAAQDITSWQR